MDVADTPTAAGARWRRILIATLVFGSSVLCSAAHAMLLINEVDYDQPGSDTAEFIELLNAGNEAVALGAYRLELINGGTGRPYRGITLPSTTLHPGELFVVCGDANAVVGCDYATGTSSGLIQNGAPDAVALFIADMAVDVLSYEGDTGGHTEGSGEGLADVNDLDYVGLSRSPEGIDTDWNARDFALRCITPGAPNSEANADCAAPTLAPPTTQAVPLPSSLALLGLGLLGVAVPAHRRWVR